METTQTPKKKMSLGKKLLIGLGVIILIGIIANAGKDEKGNADNSSTTTNSSTETTNAAPAAATIGIGQPLKTDYFEVTVSKAGLTNKLNTGNQFSDEVAGEGNQLLVMTTTFKNIDNESRMIMYRPPINWTFF